MRWLAVAGVLCCAVGLVAALAWPRTQRAQGTRDEQPALVRADARATSADGGSRSHQAKAPGQASPTALDARAAPADHSVISIAKRKKTPKVNGRHTHIKKPTAPAKKPRRKNDAGYGGRVGGL